MIGSSSMTSDKRRIDTLISGEVEVDEGQIIQFVQPLIGFDDLQQFVLLHTGEGPLYWLQSIERKEAAFAVLAPFQAGLDPEITISGRDAAEIDAQGVEDIDVYTLMVLDKDPDRIRTNLRAPILVARSSNRAKQAVLDDQRLPVQFFLRDLLAPIARG